MSGPRCPVCRTRRKTWEAVRDHQQRCGHLYACRCGGFHFPHRPGSSACDLSPRNTYYRALRNGVPKNDAEALLWADKLEMMA